MKIGKITVAVAAGIVAGSSAMGSMVTWDFSSSFSGPAPNTTAPWLKAVLDDSTANQVKVTLSFGTVPAGSYLDSFYMNYDPTKNASTALTVAAPKSHGDTVGVTLSSNNGQTSALKADGDGYYDIALQFPNPSAGRFVPADGTYAFVITGTGITDSSFNFDSQGSATPLLAMGHLAGYTLPNQSGTQSSWLNASIETAVPEPTTVIAGALLLLPFAAGAFRSLRRSRTDS